MTTKTNVECNCRLMGIRITRRPRFDRLPQMSLERATVWDFTKHPYNMESLMVSMNSSPQYSKRSVKWFLKL